jgi:plasmid stabilization system protein ParE
MAADVVLAPEAHLDIAEAYVRYESRRPGLGEEFLSSLDASMESLRRLPEMCQVVHGVYRRALIRRFPYAVFYEYAAARITVYAVFHASRDPQKWRERLP